MRPDGEGAVGDERDEGRQEGAGGEASPAVRKLAEVFAPRIQDLRTRVTDGERAFVLRGAAMEQRGFPMRIVLLAQLQEGAEIRRRDEVVTPEEYARMLADLIPGSGTGLYEIHPGDWEG